MTRTIRAVLRYTQSDLKWAVLLIVLLGLLGEGIAAIAVLSGEPEIAPQILLAMILALSCLVTLIFMAVYLSTQFMVFLSFSTTRRGLTLGLLLHGLRISGLQVALTVLWGTVDALARRAFLGEAALPWQWIPWPVWPLVLAGPMWVSLVVGAVFQRFGARGVGVLYLLFILSTTTINQWLHPVIAFFPTALWLPLLAAAVLLWATLTCLSVRWMQRATIR